mmetsp:Transcript_113904/g.318200  ORF Transcript_113904/g.318200 Transcript_113904/m.318200 type:complete len:217 (+) Transcript_113904:513-1163(+)
MHIDPEDLPQRRGVCAPHLRVAMVLQLVAELLPPLGGLVARELLGLHMLVHRCHVAHGLHVVVRRPLVGVHHERVECRGQVRAEAREDLVRRAVDEAVGGAYPEEVLRHDVQEAGDRVEREAHRGLGRLDELGAARRLQALVVVPLRQERLAALQRVCPAPCVQRSLELNGVEVLAGTEALQARREDCDRPHGAHRERAIAPRARARRFTWPGRGA